MVNWCYPCFNFSILLNIRTMLLTFHQQTYCWTICAPIHVSVLLVNLYLPCYPCTFARRINHIKMAYLHDEFLSDCRAWFITLLYEYTKNDRTMQITYQKQTSFHLPLLHNRMQTLLKYSFWTKKHI